MVIQGNNVICMFFAHDVYSSAVMYTKEEVPKLWGTKISHIYQKGNRYANGLANHARMRHAAVRRQP